MEKKRDTKYMIVASVLDNGVDRVEGYRVTRADGTASPLMLTRGAARQWAVENGLARPRGPSTGQSMIKGIVALGQRNDFSAWTVEERATVRAAAAALIVNLDKVG